MWKKIISWACRKSGIIPVPYSYVQKLDSKVSICTKSIKKMDKECATYIKWNTKASAYRKVAKQLRRYFDSKNKRNEK